jgi:hypothetical protein
MKKKITIIFFILFGVLLAASLTTSYIDSARVRNSVEPKYTIKIVSEDGKKITYWGLGYKVIRYTSAHPNESYKNNVGVKYGSWFMDYDKSETNAFNIKNIDKTISFANWSSSRKIYENALNQDKFTIENIKNIPIYKFDSLNELIQFKSYYEGIYSMDGSYDEIVSFNEATEKYNEEFFSNNSLILVYISAGSGSYRYDIKDIYLDGKSFMVNIEKTNNPEVFTCDMAGWFITVAISDSAVSNVLEFDAELI